MKRFLDIKEGTATVFAVSFVVYYLYALGWPLSEGRDYWGFVAYYADFFNAEPSHQLLMLIIRPIPPFIIGTCLKIGGAALLEALHGMMYATSIMSMYCILSKWSRRVARIGVILLFAYPTFAMPFHSVCSDAYFMTAYLSWIAYIFHSFEKNTCKHYILHGIMCFILVMIRPIGIFLLLFAVFPFFSYESAIKKKVVQSLSFLSVFASLLFLFSIYNWVRYNHFDYNRTGGAFVFARAYINDGIIKPSNGPASQKLAVAVENDLLKREPYILHGTTIEDFFESGGKYRASEQMHDLICLSDRYFGWDSRYEVLRQASIEGVLAHPGRFATNVVITVVDGFLQQQYINAQVVAKDSVTLNPLYYIDFESRKQKGLESFNSNGVPVVLPSRLTTSPNMAYMSSNDKGKIVYVVNSGIVEKINRLGIDFNLPVRDGVKKISTLLRILTSLNPPVSAWLVIGLVCFLFQWRKVSTDIRYRLITAFGVLSLLTVASLSIAISNIVFQRVQYDAVFIAWALIFIVVPGMRDSVNEQHRE